LATTLWDPRPAIFSTEPLRSYSLCNVLSDERMDLSFYNCYWPSPAQSLLGPSSAGLMTIFYCLRLETPPTCRSRSPYLYPSETGCPSYTPRCWVPSSSPRTTRRATVEVLEPASTGAAQSVTTTWTSPPYNPVVRTEKTQLFYCCVWIGYRKDVFTEPLLSNDNGADHRKHRFQHILCCCVLIRCLGNMFVCDRYLVTVYTLE
jgi:hypothetical protein